MSLKEFFENLAPLPDTWLSKDIQIKRKTKPETPHSEMLPCESWDELVEAWSLALKWNDTLNASLASLLATCISTLMQGDQVWLRLIGVAGTAKSTLCEGISKNVEHVKAVSMLTGLHSGWTDTPDGSDASLITKIKNKTLVVNEGDMILKAPNRDLIMAELRDLYTGIARCHYRNGKEEVYSGLRTTVVLAGTPSLRQLNKSALGDRFLDCIVYQKKNEIEEKQMVTESLDNTILECLTLATTDTEQESKEKVIAQQKTAGYLNYLKSNLAATLSSENFRRDIPTSISNNSETLGSFIASMRTRCGLTDEEETEKELHFRLSKQMRKLFVSLAVVTNSKWSLSQKITAKVASDTSYGLTYSIVKEIKKAEYLDVRTLCLRLQKTEETIRKYLVTLQKINCLRLDTIGGSNGVGRTRQVYRLHLNTSQQLKKLKDLQGD